MYIARVITRQTCLSRIENIINVPTPKQYMCSLYLYPPQFNGEPRSYTRFNLTQNMEGDNSHVEMKLSTDADEEVEGNGVGEHHRSNGVHGPYMVRKTVRSQRNVCFLLSATLLIFVIGKKWGDASDVWIE